MSLTSKSAAQQMAEFQKTTAQLAQMEEEARLHPTNFQNLILSAAPCSKCSKPTAQWDISTRR